MSITLAEIRTQARQRADMENSQFTTDSELNAYINSSIAELYDLLVAAYGGDYQMSLHTFTTVNGTQDYALPADFYKLKGVDAQLTAGDDFWFSVRPFNFNERNRNQDVVWGLIGGPSIRYHLTGDNLKLTPTPTGTYNMRFYYVPVAPTLIDDSDELNDLNRFVEYVIVDCAIKMLQKEESDVTVLQMQKADLRKRIENMSADRDAGQPESVSDIYAENNEYWFWRSGN